MIKWGYRFIIDCVLADPLVVQCRDRDDVRPLSYLCEIPCIFSIWYSSSHSDPIVCPRVQVSDNTAVSFALVDLSELFYTRHLDSDPVFQKVLYLLRPERELLIVFVYVFPLKLNGCRGTLSLGENPLLQ